MHPRRRPARRRTTSLPDPTRVALHPSRRHHLLRLTAPPEPHRSPGGRDCGWDQGCADCADRTSASWTRNSPPGPLRPGRPRWRYRRSRRRQPAISAAQAASGDARLYRGGIGISSALRQRQTTDHHRPPASAAATASAPRTRLSGWPRWPVKRSIRRGPEQPPDRFPRPVRTTPHSPVRHHRTVQGWRHQSSPLRRSPATGGAANVSCSSRLRRTMAGVHCSDRKRRAWSRSCLRSSKVEIHVSPCSDRPNHDYAVSRPPGDYLYPPDAAIRCNLPAERRL